LGAGFQEEGVNTDGAVAETKSLAPEAAKTPLVELGLPNVVLELSVSGEHQVLVEEMSGEDPT
jgi:hypothetical protein